MGTEDKGKAVRSLEAPSLKLGRKKKAEPKPEAPAAGPAAAAPPVEPRSTAPAPTSPGPTPPPAPAASAAASPAPAASPTPRAEPAPQPVPRTAPGSASRATPAESAETAAPRPPRKPAFTLPHVSGTVAAAITGALVSLVLLGLTWLSLGLCEAASGTSSCGGAGFPLLLLVVAGAVVAGALLLSAFRVPSAGSISFLAVALVAVLTMVFFADALDAWWIAIAVPVLSIGSFLLAHLVTVRYIDPSDD